ncbi:MAG: hypothetical protein HC888_18695 [Candidatus Competibacteraceae bacterium]|nr:hypothetical protein [Candidatus Competibacteraceae bacterium]
MEFDFQIRYAPTEVPDTSGVVWVDEAVTGTPTSIWFQDATEGARSNLLTKRNQVPALSHPYQGKMVLTRFDGLSGSALIDAKTSLTSFDKSKEQLRRQSAALSHYGLAGIIELPSRRRHWPHSAF